MLALRYTPFLWGGIQKSTCFLHVTVATAMKKISGSTLRLREYKTMMESKLENMETPQKKG